MPLKKKPSRRIVVALSNVRKAALSLPETEERPCYGTPGFRVRKKLMARLREDGETLVLTMDFDSRAILMRGEPDVFFITDHYRDYPYVLVNLNKVTQSTLARLLEDAWEQVAPKQLVALRRKSS